MYLEWFTLLCLEDNKRYSSTIQSLETDDGLEVNEDEVEIGSTVIWSYRGAPYKAKVLSIHGKNKNAQSLYDHSIVSEPILVRINKIRAADLK